MFVVLVVWFDNIVLLNVQFLFMDICQCHCLRNTILKTDIQPWSKNSLYYAVHPQTKFED